MGAIFLIILHTFLLNPVRALLVVLLRLPRHFLVEYHRGLLTTNPDDNASPPASSADEDSASDTDDQRHPEDEELSRFLNFQLQHQIQLLENATSTTAPAAATAALPPNRDPTDSGPDTPAVNTSARLPVVLNYRRRELQRDNSLDLTATDLQVDDPLNYFFHNPPPPRRSATSNRTMTASNSSNNSSSKPSPAYTVYTDKKWENIINEMNVSLHDLDSLIVNYLMVEGYQNAARKFVKEANLSLATAGLDGLALPYSDAGIASASAGGGSGGPAGFPDSEAVFASVRDRMAIKHSIHAGKIQAAIEKINDVDPELLDVHEDLHFSLLRLQLIELIRACNYPATLPAGSATPVVSPNDIAPVLEFAAAHLARRAPSNPKFLLDLERTMALLCFPPNEQALPAELRGLLDVKLRDQVALKVNAVILARQGIEGQPKIVNLLRLWGWGEQQLAAENVVFPRLNSAHLN